MSRGASADNQELKVVAETRNRMKILEVPFGRDTFVAYVKIIKNSGRNESI